MIPARKIRMVRARKGVKEVAKSKRKYSVRNVSQNTSVVESWEPDLKQERRVVLDPSRQGYICRQLWKYAGAHFVWRHNRNLA